MKHSGIYFIYDGVATKVGYTGNILMRMKTLQTGNPRTLELLDVLGTGGRLREEWTHENLEELGYVKTRPKGEWFEGKITRTDITTAVNETETRAAAYKRRRDIRRAKTASRKLLAATNA